MQWAAPAAPLSAELSGPDEAATAAIVAALPDAASVLVVRTAVSGDFSNYTLTLVRSAIDDALPDHFDPRLDSIDFSFKVECPSDFDCAPQRFCPPPAVDAPDINYLAKDYASFRRLMLDRMAQLVPDWEQTSIADEGVAVAELIAYAADQLSYQQDAIATEAYLGTARERVSLRRHALLVDYPMHDGCNARTWLQLQAASATFLLPLVGTQFLTRLPGFATGIATDSARLDAAMRSGPRSSSRCSMRATRSSPIPPSGRLSPADLRRAQPDLVLHVERRPLLPGARRDLGDAEWQLSRPRRRRRVAVRGGARPEHRQGRRRRSDASPRRAADVGAADAAGGADRPAHRRSRSPRSNGRSPTRCLSRSASPA